MDENPRIARISRAQPPPSVLIVLRAGQPTSASHRLLLVLRAGQPTPASCHPAAAAISDQIVRISPRPHSLGNSEARSGPSEALPEPVHSRPSPPPASRASRPLPAAEAAAPASPVGIPSAAPSPSASSVTSTSSRRTTRSNRRRTKLSGRRKLSEMLALGPAAPDAARSEPTRPLPPRSAVPDLRRLVGAARSSAARVFSRHRQIGNEASPPQAPGDVRPRPGSSRSDEIRATAPPAARIHCPRPPLSRGRRQELRSSRLQPPSGTRCPTLTPPQLPRVCFALGPQPAGPAGAAPHRHRPACSAHW